MTTNADVTSERDTRADWTSNEQAAAGFVFVIWIEGWKEVTQKTSIAKFYAVLIEANNTH